MLCKVDLLMTNLKSGEISFFQGYIFTAWFSKWRQSWYLQYAVSLTGQCFFYVAHVLIYLKFLVLDYIGHD